MNMYSTPAADTDVIGTSAQFEQADGGALRRYLEAYRPFDVAEHVWLRIAREAIELVLRAGRPTRLRVEKDIQCVGHVVAHLVDRGRPTTLDEVLEDRTILSYDLQLQKRSAASRTRENQRGILRRLQAAHRGLPWRQPRRADGERVATMVQPSALDRLQGLEGLAHAAATDNTHPDAILALETLATARAIRAGKDAAIGTFAWLATRRFAEDHGMPLTKVILSAAITYEVLGQQLPAAVLITTYRLTRRDLDLALVLAKTLPRVPSAEHVELLRGPDPSH